MNELAKRKQLRLKDFDYSQNGYYFITICTYNRQQILSDVCRGGVLLRPIGKIVETEIYELIKRYSIEINPYIIMPDHIHMIIKINRNEQRDDKRAEQSPRTEQSPAPTATLGDIICAFKSLTTKIANANDNCSGRKIWQRNYYEHIIRDENDYMTRAEYILNNPLKWELGTYNERAEQSPAPTGHQNGGGTGDKRAEQSPAPTGRPNGGIIEAGKG